jgi:hypothetical protein
VVASAFVGVLIGTVLPTHHRTRRTENVVNLGIGLMATLSALVIGLLIASAKSSFDAKDAGLRQFAANLILLDRQLSHYGPETKPVHDLLRRYTVFAIHSTWPEEASEPVEDGDGWARIEDIQDALRRLEPRNDGERWLQSRALTLSGDLARIHWRFDVGSGHSIPGPFLVVLVVWLIVIFTSFGLFAPRNATVYATLVVCSLSVAGAVVLILEMDQPFGGLIQVSSAPMREALAQLGP